jgi:WhiB family redox-sensing transcriptional regulator
MIHRPEWQARASCAGSSPDLWFPDMMADGGTQRAASDLYEEARKVCAGCEVRYECLEWGMSDVDFGLYGGLSPKERRLLKAERLRQSSNLASV